MWDGDGFTPRDLTDDSIYMGMLEETSLDDHDRRKAIGNFFYRLVQADVATPQRMMQVVLRTISDMNDADMDGKLEASDFKAAIDMQAQVGETELQAAIDQIWLDMDGPNAGQGGGGGGGGGGGSGSGSAPTFSPSPVYGAFKYCSNSPPGCPVYSIYDLSWSYVTSLRLPESTLRPAGAAAGSSG
jgi:hypothetical protein